MDVFTRSELRNLIERGLTEGEPCLSVYMPTHRTGREIREDSLRCKNLLNEAEERLRDGGLRTPDARELLAPLWKLQEDGLFWKKQSDGLVLFATRGFAVHFRLPLAFDELLVVNRRFHVTPILPLLQGDGRFHLLAASQKRVRFLGGTKQAVSEMEVAGLPRSLREALDVDEYMRSLQLHSHIISGAKGSTEAIFHGHGGADLDVKKKDELRQYFHRLDAGLRKFFGEDRTPLVFAGVDYLFPIFREACSYGRLVEQAVKGNPDDLSAKELHAKAWGIVEPYFRRDQEEARQRYVERRNAKGVAHDLDEVIRAAREGRVDTLFIARHRTVWGSVDPATGEITRLEPARPGAEDLLDHAAVHTLLKGGAVYALDRDEMPEDSPAAAVLRYVP